MEFLKMLLKLNSVLCALAVTAAGALVGCAAPSNPNQAPSAAQGVYFMEPANGATVTSPFMVKFGVKGMQVQAAGDQVANVGHHHLLINLESKPKGEIIPFDDAHIHFGKGQTETMVTLKPGTYKITMQFADGYHLSYGKDMSATMTVTVK
jgi:Domain of unknown function (DUF4399)